jgi:hypothetical protein
MTKTRALTEAQWHTSNEAPRMLRYLQQHQRSAKVPGGRRRLRLFSCGCCRLVWHLIADERCRRTVEVAENAADGKASRVDLADAEQEAADAGRAAQKLRAQASPGPPYSGPFVRAFVAEMLASAARSAATSLLLGRFIEISTSSIRVAVQWATQAEGGGETAARAVEARQAQLVRDVFGNPFRQRPTVDPAWLTWGRGAVARLAQTIYDERRFGDLPVLADALEEAGCADADILAHCRSADAHARGCWAVDLLLGKG